MAKSKDNSTAALVGELNGLLADHYALYLKTKSFHWHVQGPRFRDLHLLFDEQAHEIRGQTDIIAERVRKLDAETLTSIGSIAKHTSIKDQDSTSLKPDEMVSELLGDNQATVARLKAMKELTEEAGDNATDGLIDEWTDAAEKRVWFLKAILSEASPNAA